MTKQTEEPHVRNRRRLWNAATFATGFAAGMIALVLFDPRTLAEAKVETFDVRQVRRWNYEPGVYPPHTMEIQYVEEDGDIRSIDVPAGWGIETVDKKRAGKVEITHHWYGRTARLFVEK